MANCPHCNKPLELPTAPEYNVTTYRRPVMTKTLCCGRGVNLTAVVTIHTTPYIGNNHIDDWGHEIKPTDPKLVAKLLK